MILSHPSEDPKHFFLLLPSTVHGRKRRHQRSLHVWPKRFSVGLPRGTIPHVPHDVRPPAQVDAPEKLRNVKKVRRHGHVCQGEIFIAVAEEILPAGEYTVEGVHASVGLLQARVVNLPVHLQKTDRIEARVRPGDPAVDLGPPPGTDVAVLSRVGLRLEIAEDGAAFEHDRAARVVRETRDLTEGVGVGGQVVRHAERDAELVGSPVHERRPRSL
mmetsp:Transcript_25252/g.58341  ORF Transcript_25252/g.58341 Transcript_25252/m.58341 type:complete len:216 (-) Transcript_25252:308-955(-)